MKFLTLIILVLLILTGCENTGVVETEIEYKEKIVIRAELILETTFSGVTITKTLPVNEQYDINKAEIKNAFSYLRINDYQIIPLHYTEKGIYKPLYNYEFHENSKVELFGEANGKTFYSKTIIPNHPAVSNPTRENNYLYASVDIKPEEVYGAAWIISSSGNQIDAALNFQTISTPPVNNQQNLRVRTTDIPEKYQVNPYLDQTYIQVYSFDKAYLDYFKTRSNNQIVNNTFVQGGEAVIWNVQGKDVIGIFIGMAIGDRIKVR